MKNVRTILLLCITICSASYGQDCDKLLQGGLYSFTSMTNTGSFSKDLRTYFLSEQFKLDMKSGKWGSSLTIPILEIPLSIGINSSEETYSEFRSKLLQINEISISSNFYQTTFSTIPNTNLYQAYNDCVKIKDDVSKTGFIQGLNVETENTVVFTIYYRKQSPNDPMPTVQNFNVEPAGSILSGNLTVGQKLNSFSILVTCKRDPEKDMVLSLKTDRGSHVSKSIADGSFSSSKDLPLGTVITSFFSFDKFSEATKNNEKSPGGIWTSAKSKWAPCDGRPLPNSKYSKLASQPNAPDLRGLFLRGLNAFDPYYTVPPQNPSQLNPDEKPSGVYQKDAIANHSHNISSSTNVLRFVEGGNLKGGDGAAFMNAINNPNKGGGALLTTDNDGGGNETRPKHVTVYYYIRIN